MSTLEKFSYSKLNTYEGCGWKYKLVYIDKNFVDGSTIANEFGTLVHFVEETIARDIIANDNEPNFMINDEKYIQLFIEGTEDVLGIKKLKEKYPNDFYTADKSGMDYSDKANDYLNYGIYRLRDYLAQNRNIIILDVEKEFNLEYEGYIFHGFIDRILKDTDTGELFIQDIKTWFSIDNHDLVTPLQFVFYSLAAQEIYSVDERFISCFYDLPLAKQTYQAGTKGFVKRGCKKINKLLEKIKAEDFIPNPSPLCAYCPFSITNNSKELTETNYLCPYHSLWTKDRKVHGVEYEWMGIENHEAIIENYKKLLKNSRQKSSQKIELKPAIETSSDGRFYLIRR